MHNNNEKTIYNYFTFVLLDAFQPATKWMTPEDKEISCCHCTTTLLQLNLLLIVLSLAPLSQLLRPTHTTTTLLYHSIICFSSHETSASWWIRLTNNFYKRKNMQPKVATNIIPLIFVNSWHTFWLLILAGKDII